MINLLKEKTYMENVALQLSESIAELHKKNIPTYELIKAVLFGMYSEGYKDANVERNKSLSELTKASDLWKGMDNLEDLMKPLKHKYK